MNHRSLHSHPLVTGTLLLTVTGLLSRIIGFFFRIFLSQSIGAEAMGIYQLTFPIHVLTISLTSSAIQTAISRFVVNRKQPTLICPIMFPWERIWTGRTA